MPSGGPAHGRRHRRLRAARTTSPRSSSARPSARAGSRWSTAPLCAISSLHAGNISVHVIAGDRRRPRRARAPPSPPRRPNVEPIELPPYAAALAMVAAALGVAEVDRAELRRPERRPRVPHRDRRRRRHLRALSLAVCGRSSRRCPIISSSCRRSTRSRSPIRPMSPRCSSSPWWRSSSPTSRRARARRPRSRRPAPASPRRSIQLCAQARRLRLDRRRACGPPPIRWPRCSKPQRRPAACRRTDASS